MIKRLETEEELRAWYKNFKQKVYDEVQIDLDNEADLGRVQTYDPDVTQWNGDEIRGKLRFMYIPMEKQEQVYEPIEQLRDENRNYPEWLELLTKWAYDNQQADESIDKIKQLYEKSIKGELFVTEPDSMNPRSVLTGIDGSIHIFSSQDKKMSAEEEKYMSQQEPERSQFTSEEAYKAELEKYDYNNRQKVNMNRCMGKITERTMEFNQNREYANGTMEAARYIPLFWKYKSAEELDMEQFKEDPGFQTYQEIKENINEVMWNDRKRRVQSLLHVLEKMDRIRVYESGTIKMDCAQEYKKNFTLRGYLVQHVKQLADSDIKDCSQKMKEVETDLKDYLQWLHTWEIKGDAKRQQHVYAQWKVLLEKNKDLFSEDMQNQINEYITSDPVPVSESAKKTISIYEESKIEIDYTKKK